MPDSSALVPYPNQQHAFGEFVGDNLKNLANAAADTACNLYQNYPGFMTGSMFNNPIAPYNDGLLNSLCAPRNKLPAAPSVPFTGGQCQCISYLVSFNYSIVGGSSGSNAIVVPGPVSAIVKEAISPSTSQPVLYNFGVYGGSDACGGNRYFELIGNVSDGSTCTITSVVRQDSQPDTCGDPPSQYPRVRPPDYQLNTTVNVQVSPNFSVVAPVEVFAPVTNFSPQLALGPFNVDFNLGGINISPSVNIGTGNQNQVTQPVPTPPPTQSQPDRNYDEILSLIVKYLHYQRLCDPTDCDYDFHVTGAYGGQSNQIPVPAGGIPVAVALSIVQQPVNAKREYGVTSPDVLYAGWAWWSGNSNLEAREPIDSQFKLYRAAENPSPTQFVWTCRTGFQAQAIMTYKTLKSPLPPVS